MPKPGLARRSLVISYVMVFVMLGALLASPILYSIAGGDLSGAPWVYMVALAFLWQLLVVHCHPRRFVPWILALIYGAILVALAFIPMA